MKRTSRYLICGILPLCLNSIAIGLPFSALVPDAQGPAGAPLSLSDHLDGPSSSLNGLLPPWLDVPRAIDGGALYTPLAGPGLGLTSNGPSRSQVAGVALAPADLRDFILRPEASLRNLGLKASDQDGPREARGESANPANTPVSISEPMGRTLILLGLIGLVLRTHLGGALTWGRNQTKPFLRFHGFWWAMTRS